MQRHSNTQVNRFSKYSKWEYIINENNQFVLSQESHPLYTHIHKSMILESYLEINENANPWLLTNEILMMIILLLINHLPLISSRAILFSTLSVRGHSWGVSYHKYACSLEDGCSFGVWVYVHGRRGT